MADRRDALWQTGHDESVEVNQRALIDKVLARYSGEFTVFRELLQNSDDAGSKSVEIRFETNAYLESQKDGSPNTQGVVDKGKLPNLKTAMVHQWTFKNNGMPFRDEDWNRLKKIAEGNPDEEKIGAFGVGFYSLFSVTEEPWVTSGGQWMNFYWKDKKDQLFARRGTLPITESSGPDPWTTFLMTLREPAPIPPAFDFARFLASSITFMTTLSEISVYFDGTRLVRLSKEGGMAKEMTMLKGLKSTSPNGTMTVKGIRTTPLHMQAEVIRWVYSVGTKKQAAARKAATKPQQGGFFSSLFGFGSSSAQQREPTPKPVEAEKEPDLLETFESSVVLSIFSANIDVKLDKKMTAELQRSTKKNPPQHMRYELIYTGKDEYDASVKAEEKVPFATGSVFQGLRADLDGSGSARIFIGHSTGQTTGIGGHMAARFIPTVERESVDLVDRNVAVWNKELLYVGGFLARSAYEIELGNIKNLWTGAAASGGPDKQIDLELRTWLSNRALHAMKFFTFHASTPSSVISGLMESAFFTCATTHPFSIISSEGVMSAADVRVPDAAFSGFLTRLPILPEDVSKNAESMVSALRARGMIKDISFIDVLKELRSRPLSEAEGIACLKWWVDINKQTTGIDVLQGRSQLLDAAVLAITDSNSGDERILPMSSVRSFLNPRNMGAMIPLDGPLPDHLLPQSISRAFDPDVLTSVFPWRAFTVVDWLAHITTPSVAAANKEFDVTTSAPWAERAIGVLARAWPSLPKASQDKAVEILQKKSCIPTSSGMKVPTEAYFPSANLFRDLPIVTLPSGAAIKGHLEKVLQALGVRKHVELQLVFDRMIKTGDWTIIDLVKYLVSVQSTLTKLELDRLRHTAAFPKEVPAEEKAAAAQTKRKVSRFTASALYEPLDIFRELQLPVIDWGLENKWKPSSDEAKFLYSLGLLRSPPLRTILELAAREDAALRAKALKYFLDNFTTKYSLYDPHDFKDLAYIPAVNGSAKLMAKPTEVYANPEWALFDFAIINPNLQADALTKLKISQHPPAAQLISLLEKSPPSNEAIAKQWFEVLASRISDFSPSQLQRLAVLPFVPTKSSASKGSAVTRLSPNQCYFTGSSGDNLHSKLFTFVDFGTRANAFLSACGTRQEPSVDEIVKILLSNPRNFYELAGSKENYLSELRNFAVNMKLLSSSTILRMKHSNILLGSRRVRKNKSSVSKSSAVDEDDEWDAEDDLLRPDKVIIADDSNVYHLFGDSIFTAPQEDLLEEFYIALGSRRLSSLVKEEYKTTSELPSSQVASDTRALILERLPLFLHEHSHSKTKVSYSWLSKGNNFVVRTFGKLQVTRSLNYGDIRLSRSLDASAAAKTDGRGPVELWLSGNTQVDMYEVSVSLCKLLFNELKVNDALLFMTILSTNLKALKRRGYNVDRILQQQKAKHEEAMEKVKQAEAKAKALVSDKAESKLLSPPPAPSTSSREKGQELVSSTTNPSSPPVVGGVRNSLQNLRKFINPNQNNNTHERPTSMIKAPGAPGAPGVPGGFQPSTQSGVTPLSNIASNIDMAINACREETGHLLRNREQMQMVKESLNEGYCDVSGQAGDLDLIGSMGSISVYASHGVSNRQSLLQQKKDSIARFIHVLQPLAQIYRLPSSSLHIFYDAEGQLIAFNRNGSLFVNLRYYEAWHDHDVQKGDMSQAFISWYFSLAHEIAHNLVQPHNSEHEFYFSSICEQYLIALSQLIASH
ncbi:hypothetical protein DENSPDRAFT_659742 [Dentipellis sp. KUC8613]|nr:hypothetical protein DENSPDRAFT_659742 [Dentipellis sp. KUC8613]